MIRCLRQQLSLYRCQARNERLTPASYLEAGALYRAFGFAYGSLQTPASQR